MTDTTDDERTLSRRERNELEKRRRLFEAASDLFARHGYSAVTTQQIADAADVGTGTLFRCFPTKADLFVEVMNRRSATASGAASPRPRAERTRPTRSSP